MAKFRASPMTDKELARKIVVDWWDKYDKYSARNSRESLSGTIAAALAAERERCRETCEMALVIDADKAGEARIRADERERCARICEERYIDWPQADASLKDVASGCAAAIRALGSDD